MTGKEAKTALFSETPVTYDNCEYQKITAIIYRKMKTELLVSVEMLDKNGRTPVIARMDKVQLAEEKEDKEND